MRRKTGFLSFLFVFTFLSLVWIEVSAQVSLSIIPFLENLEITPADKYSENFRLKIEELLKRKDEKIRIVTYNVLFDVFDHKLKDKTLAWVQRFPNVVASIENMHPDILCVQETYPSQLNDLKQSLKDGYSCFVGLSTKGELNAIFYRKDRFELDMGLYQIDDLDVSSASIKLPLNPKDDCLLSKVPNLLPSDLEPGRQLTLAHFRDRLTGKSFTVINTHLNYYRINSREDQADFIEKLVRGLHTLNKPVILSGDFNTFPNRPDRLQLPFYDGNHLCQIFQRVLNDTRAVALLGHVGPISTGLKDFLERGDAPFQNSEDSDVILDHIYTSPSISVIITATEPSLVNDHFPSDHMPVIADILLP